jgi:hypothetical protein
MYCAPTKAEALRDGGPYATNYYRFFQALSSQGPVKTLSDAYKELRGEDLDKLNRVLLGHPDDLIPRILLIGETFGLDLLLLEVAQGEAPPANVFKALELFGREVLPHVQRKPNGAIARPPSRTFATDGRK